MDHEHSMLHRSRRHPMPPFLKQTAGLKREPSGRPARDAARRRARPDLESLEARDLKTASLANGVLAIVGTNVRNDVTVERDTRLTFSPYDDRITVSEVNNGGPFGQVHSFPIYTLYTTPGGYPIFFK